MTLASPGMLLLPSHLLLRRVGDLPLGTRHCKRKGLGLGFRFWGVGVRVKCLGFRGYEGSLLLQIGHLLIYTYKGQAHVSI